MTYKALLGVDISDDGDPRGLKEVKASMVGGKRLLLEKEAAQILRCSTSRVKRLRLGGQLAYIPGRPVLIDAEDLDEYIEMIKTREAEKAAREKAKKSPDRLAREAWLKHQARRGRL